MKAGRPFVIAAALAAAAGTAQGQEYDLYIVEALSTFGIPESYLSELNNEGVAAGFMTYTEQDPSGSYHTTYKGYFWTPDGGPDVRTDTSSINGLNDLGDWTTGGAIRLADGRTFALTVLPGDRSVHAGNINNQRTVIGSSVYRYHSGCRYTREAVVWTEATGTLGLETHLGVPSADVASDINNHNEIVGMRSFSGSCGSFQAFLYRFDTGEHVDLHQMLGATGITEAHAINDLGQVAGEGSHASGVSAWLWTPGEGFVFLPGLKGGGADRVRPTALTDSAEMVGYAMTGAEEWRAFLWTESGGMQDLNDFADVPANFSLDRALNINEDGWIVGDGHWGGPVWGPAVAWVLIPRDSSCSADCDASGSLDFFDFLCFQNQFAAGAPEADCDSSGEHDFFDFLCFQNEFAAGCP